MSEQLLRMQNFLLQDPKNINLIQDCFNLSFELGKFDIAQAILDSAINNNIYNSSIQFYQSKIHLAAGQYKLACEVLNELIDSGVENSGIIYNLIWAKFNLGGFDELLSDLAKYDRYLEEYPPITLIKVRALHHLQRTEEALSILRNYLKSHKDDSEANGLAALILVDLSLIEKSREAANIALSIDPNNHEALTSLSTIALNSHEPDKALEYLNKNIELTHKSGRMMLNLGQAQMLQMEFISAETSLKEATVLMSNHIGTWHMLAWIEIVLNKLDDAKKCFDKAMVLDRNFSESHGGLAVVAIYQKDLTLAKSLIRKSIRLDPECVSGRYAESLILELEGEGELAKSKVNSILTSSHSAEGIPIKNLIEKANARIKLDSKNNTIH